MVRSIAAQDIQYAQIPLREVYDLVVEGFEIHASGEYEMPPKHGVHTRPHSLMHAMPVYLPTKDLAGTKLVSVYPQNAEHGLDSLSGVIVMVDPQTGITTEIIDAVWITNTRTAMVSMVDASFLAVKNPVFGVVGATGASGRAHLDAIAAIFPGSRVLVNSRNRERCEALVHEYADRALELVVELDHEAVVKSCDVVIVTTTSQQEPIFQTEWLRAGQNVLNVHMSAWPESVLERVDLVSCDDRRQLIDPVGGIRRAYPSLDPDMELGAVITGRHPGRESADQIIASYNYGLAIFDILVADCIRSRV